MRFIVDTSKNSRWLILKASLWSWGVYQPQFRIALKRLRERL